MSLPVDVTKEIHLMCDVAPMVRPDLAHCLSCFVGFKWHPEARFWTAQLGNRWAVISAERFQVLVAEMAMNKLQFFSFN